MGSSNGYVPNTQAQIRYIVQWFHEWSEMQRSDFLPILTERFGSKGYVNGLLPGMEVIGSLEDRPPSLFQCRVKLFREWSENWGHAEKEQLLNHIKSMDPGFLAKFEDELDSVLMKPGHNSLVNENHNPVSAEDPVAEVDNDIV